MNDESDTTENEDTVATLADFEERLVGRLTKVLRDFEARMIAAFKSYDE
jgi:hypothetical protein